MRKNWILIEPFTFWYRTSNFVSLLNLLTQTKEYGPVYLHLEGVRERFIQHIKPELTNMRTSTSFNSFQDVEDKIKNGLSFSGVVFVLTTTVYGVIIKKSNVYDFYADRKSTRLNSSHP